MTSRTIDTEGIAALLGLTRQHVTDRLTKGEWVALCARNGAQRA